jgi:hypothetical protein
MMRDGLWCGSLAGAEGWWPGGGCRWCLLSAQGIDVPASANVAFTSKDRMQDVMCNFNADGSIRCTPNQGQPQTLMMSLQAGHSLHLYIPN